MRCEQIDPVTGDCSGKGGCDVDPEGNISEREIGERFGVDDKERIARRVGRAQGMYGRYEFSTVEKSNRGRQRHQIDAEWNNHRKNCNEINPFQVSIVIQEKGPPVRIFFLIPKV
jgi:hypothetical protein